MQCVVNVINPFYLGCKSISITTNMDHFFHDIKIVSAQNTAYHIYKTTFYYKLIKTITLLSVSL